MDNDNSKMLTEVIKEFKEPILHLLNPPAKAIGEGLGNLFNIVFYPFNLLYLKAKHSIDLFARECSEEINKIPEARLKEPPLNQIGPILEASKYYVEDETLRKMFAKLLASTFDIDKSQLSHVSYVEILKQLSAFEAKLLIQLSSHESLGIVNLQYYRNGTGSEGLKKGSVDIGYLVPLEIVNPMNFHNYNIALENLCRLSLIYIDNISHFTNQKLYDAAESHLCVSFFKEKYGQDKVLPKHILWRFTKFGKQFLQICV